MISESRASLFLILITFHQPFDLQMSSSFLFKLVVAQIELNSNFFYIISNHLLQLIIYCNCYFCVVINPISVCTEPIVFVCSVECQAHANEEKPSFECTVFTVQYTNCKCHYTRQYPDKFERHCLLSLSH